MSNGRKRNADSGKPSWRPVPANATNAANGHSPLNTCDFPNTEHLKPKTSGEAETEPIGTTSNHPFWSVDRQEFVQAGSLEIGERLQTLSGDVKVVQQKLPRPGPQPVFNLEVHHEHVYFVGEDGVLVHNAGPRYNSWNEFQAATNGQFATRGDAAAAYHRIRTGQSPWPDGVVPKTTTIPKGTRFEMAMSPTQQSSRPGAFGLFDQEIPSVAFTRERLAIKTGWKPEIDRVVTFEATQPFRARVGPIGPQVDELTGRFLPGGGGTQLQIIRANRMEVLRIVSERSIK